MAGELITADGQLEFSGLLLGEGTNYPIGENGIEGLGTPDLRTGERERPQSHGMFPARPYAAARTLTFGLAVLGTSQADAVAKLDTFAATWIPQESADPLPLVYRIGGQKRRVYGRADRYAAQLADLKSATIEVTAQFLATDPRIYDDTESTGSTGLATTSGGQSLPHSFPFAFGTIASGTIAAVNAGTFETYPTATITATTTLANPKIEHTDLGQYLLVGLTMAAGDQLVVDFHERTVTLNGAPRTGYVSRPASRWFALAPGTNNVRFAATSGTGTLALAWRSAWL